MSDLTLADLMKVAGQKRRSVQIWADLGLIDAYDWTKRAGAGVHKKFRESAIEDVRLLALLHDLGVDNNHKAALSRVLTANPKLRSAFEHARSLLADKAD